MGTAIPQASLKRVRVELAKFVRSRRERLDPAEFGLPTSGRRRTMGLRREELAAVAGVGLTWYTWFEQGRDIRVSTHFLSRIASVFALDAAECAYLNALAVDAPTPALSKKSSLLLDDLSPLLERVEPWPAFIKDEAWCILAWNRSADELFGGLACLNDDERNSLWATFMHLPYRARMVDWQEDAHRIVGRFRADYAHFAADHPARLMIDRLRRGSTEFDQVWQCQDVQGRDLGQRRFRYPNGADQSYRYVVSKIDSANNWRMVIHMPDDQH